MREYGPSRTALAVAMHRAAHQLLDDPRVFDDPIAVPIIGNEAIARLLQEDHRFHAAAGRRLRAFIAARSRHAEDRLADAYGLGTRQYVVLGAGLDTFAYRNPFSGLRIFEVDHPATQVWKRERLRQAGIAIPANVVYAAVDFETQTLDAGLRAAGFDPSRVAFFSWLGVTPYLTREAAMSTFRLIATLPPASRVAFDYAVDPSSLDPAQRIALGELSARVAAACEPFQLFFDPPGLAAELRRIGFRDIDDIGSAEINTRYFVSRADGLSVAGTVGRLMCASV